MGKRKRKVDLERELRKLRRKIDKLADSQSLDDELEKRHSTSRSSSIPQKLNSLEPSTPELVQEQEVQEMQEEQDTQEVQDVEETSELSVTQGTGLDTEILSAMGSVEEELINGPPVHTEIAQRWTPILTKGLKREDKTILSKQYLPFDNIPSMIPPKLNPELSAAISEPTRKRDKVIENRQRQIAIALSAMGSGLQCFLTKGNKVEGIKSFNDAAKVMCDMFHWETGSRRVLIQNVVNKDMKDSLQKEPDCFLFGKGLSEKIKAAKAVQRSAQDLSKSLPNKPFQINNQANKPLNWRAPPQRAYYKQNYRQNSDNKRHSGGGRRKMNQQEYKKEQFQQQNYQRNYRK